jgi:hypothetical protein
MMKAGLALSLAAFAVVGTVAAGHRQAGQASGKRVAVVAELFTSEGCSSCPPADDLLRQLIQDQPIAGVEVIALSEHVDYWDRLGWKDPFSSARFTARQNAYARVFGGDRIYTPQLVVNGRDEVVGNDAGAVRRALANAAKGARAGVEVSGTVAGTAAAIRVAVRDVPADANKHGLAVLAAIVEDDLASDVTRGENARRRLHHAAVTRFIDAVGTLEPKRVSTEIAREIPLDPGWRADRLRAVAFVQDPRSQRILGAAAAPLR